MLSSTDIDIDILHRDKLLETLRCVQAIEIHPETGMVKRHASGVYFQNIPVDPMTGLAVFEYKKARELGYFKVDLLSAPVYEGVQNEAHLNRLVEREPHWSLLEDRDIVNDLFHINGHFGIVQSIRPKSIEDLAVVLALIRGSKKHLVGKPRDVIDAHIWVADDKYYFKRAHAIAYATAVVVQLNLICEQIEKQLRDDDNQSS